MSASYVLIFLLHFGQLTYCKEIGQHKIVKRIFAQTVSLIKREPVLLFRQKTKIGILYLKQSSLGMVIATFIQHSQVILISQRRTGPEAMKH